MKNIIFSFYNIIIPIPETSEYLLYNTLRGGLISITEDEYRQIQEWKKVPTLIEDHRTNLLLQSLLEKEFFITTEINEPEIYHAIYMKRLEYAFYTDSADILLTIASSNACNMECPYCYEFSKNNAILNSRISKEIIHYINDMIKSSPKIKNWKSLYVTWYGGEPLLGQKAIPELTDYFKKISEEYQMKYKADIVTNGILLTKDTWLMLKNNYVEEVQVTIDGTQETHDISRPLKNKTEPNYYRILENLSNMPEDMSLTIRLNVDKKVAANFHDFLKDLEQYGIWPQRYKNVKIDVAWLRTYSEANEDDISARILSWAEWELYRERLSKIKIDYYNNWAKKNGKKPGKLRIRINQPQFDDCASVTSPYSLTIDAQGYIYKCWEVIQEKDFRVQHVTEKYDPSKFHDYLNRTRFNVKPHCLNCKYRPVCDKGVCLRKELASCKEIIHSIRSGLKAQYLMHLQYPETIIYHNNQI